MKGELLNRYGLAGEAIYGVQVVQTLLVHPLRVAQMQRGLLRGRCGRALGQYHVVRLGQQAGDRLPDQAAVVALQLRLPADGPLMLKVLHGARQPRVVVARRPTLSAGAVGFPRSATAAAATAGACWRYVARRVRGMEVKLGRVERLAEELAHLQTRAEALPARAAET